MQCTNTSLICHDYFIMFSSSSSPPSSLPLLQPDYVSLICYPTVVAASCVFLENSATCFCDEFGCNKEARLRVPLLGWSEEQLLEIGVPRSMIGEQSDDARAAEDGDAGVKTRRAAGENAKDARNAMARSMATQLEETQVEARERRSAEGKNSGWKRVV